MSSGVWRPKNPHSLEHLKYLYGVLCKNTTVTEQNLGLLVETLRSISEILIWGDQNDGSVFDFFLEKNMLVFFLRFMRQKSGRHICVQLLQTLNILFENISNETSVYYLLSNNHINSIIVHKFDFSDEEVMAYYISFLKTLSLKLNKHTIHFFYNEHTNDFALYTEAIKFFNHAESMVRIAVRTITLNVYRACHLMTVLDNQGQPVVDDKSMLSYIRDRTAAPYFSNLVWFIGNHVIELDTCVQQDTDHNSRGRLADLVAEHLDHLHYLNDILCLDISALNDVLADHLLNRLFLPLYVCSLTPALQPRDTSSQLANDLSPRISSVMSLFLLAQVFLIIHHPPLVRKLAMFIFNGKLDVAGALPSLASDLSTSYGFVKPCQALADSLNVIRPTQLNEFDDDDNEEEDQQASQAATAAPDIANSAAASVVTTHTENDQSNILEATTEHVETAVCSGGTDAAEVHTDLEVNVASTNCTDEEKLYRSCALASCGLTCDLNLADRPNLSAIFNALYCVDGDYQALFALCLLYAMSFNKGIGSDLLDSALMPTDLSETKHHYNTTLVDRLIHIMSLSCQSGSKVRLVTLELSILLLKSLVYSAKDGHSFLQDDHLAAIEGSREEATLLMRNFYKVWEKSEEIFLDMFEDEYRELMSRPLNVEYLTMDASIILPPTSTPLTGIDFNRRLPCGEVERAKRAIRVFFLIRNLSFALRQEAELQLPLTREDECVKVDDILDLNNSDLIACTIIAKDSNKKDRRFLVIDSIQLILVEPDSKRLGWGVVRFVGFLQDVEVTGDKDDSRCLHVTVLRPTSISGGPAASCRPPPRPLLAAKFIFDDHIRCMAARQRLVKGRLRARQRKMQMIARLLDLPISSVDTAATSRPPSHRSTSAATGVQSAIPGRSHVVQRLLPTSSGVQQSVFASVDQVAAFGSAVAREQEQQLSKRRMPRVAQPQVTASSTAAVNKKKLLSMAFQAQKQRREAAAAAAAVATAAGQSVDTLSSSDTDSGSASRCLSEDQQTTLDNNSDGRPSSQIANEELSLVDDYRPQSVSHTKSQTVPGTPPKSLIPAASLPASLVLDDIAESLDLDSPKAGNVLDSPVKLVLPADPEFIHSLAMPNSDQHSVVISQQMNADQQSNSDHQSCADPPSSPDIESSSDTPN